MIEDYDYILADVEDYDLKYELYLIISEIEFYNLVEYHDMIQTVKILAVEYNLLLYNIENKYKLYISEKYYGSFLNYCLK